MCCQDNSLEGWLPPPNNSRESALLLGPKEQEHCCVEGTSCLSPKITTSLWNSFSVTFSAPVDRIVWSLLLLQINSLSITCSLWKRMINTVLTPTSASYTFQASVVILFSPRFSEVLFQYYMYKNTLTVSSNDAIQNEWNALTGWRKSSPGLTLLLSLFRETACNKLGTDFPLSQLLKNLKYHLLVKFSLQNFTTVSGFIESNTANSFYHPVHHAFHWVSHTTILPKQKMSINFQKQFQVRHLYLQLWSELETKCIFTCCSVTKKKSKNCVRSYNGSLSVIARPNINGLQPVYCASTYWLQSVSPRTL